MANGKMKYQWISENKNNPVFYLVNGIEVYSSCTYLHDKLCLNPTSNLRVKFNKITTRVNQVNHLLRSPRTPGGRLNKKDGLTRYGNSHVKDKTS